MVLYVIVRENYHTSISLVAKCHDPLSTGLGNAFLEGFKQGFLKGIYT